jgi:SAM-dependent methyltransferase
VVSGDFFRSVPEGGDAYLLKLVLHDWDDERALQILRNCQRVMRPNGTLLLVDFVLRAGDERDFGKFADLEMLVLNSGGRERTELEFRDLLGKAGFRLTRIVPTVAPKSVIEALRW